MRTSPVESLKRKSYGKSPSSVSFRQPRSDATTFSLNAASAMTPLMPLKVRSLALSIASKIISACVLSLVSSGWIGNSRRRYSKISRLCVSVQPSSSRLTSLILLFTVPSHLEPARSAPPETLDISKANKSMPSDFNAFYPAFGHKLPNRLPGNTTKFSRFGLGYPV